MKQTFRAQQRSNTSSEPHQCTPGETGIRCVSHGLLPLLIFESNRFEETSIGLVKLGWTVTSVGNQLRRLYMSYMDTLLFKNTGTPSAGTENILFQHLKATVGTLTKCSFTEEGMLVATIVPLCAQTIITVSIFQPCLETTQWDWRKSLHNWGQYCSGEYMTGMVSSTVWSLIQYRFV